MGDAVNNRERDNGCCEQTDGCPRCAWKGCHRSEIYLRWLGFELCVEHWFEVCGLQEAGNTNRVIIDQYLGQPVDAGEGELVFQGGFCEFPDST